MVRKEAPKEEHWLFVVTTEGDLKDELAEQIHGILEELEISEGLSWCVRALSALPVTPEGRILKQATERFVNQQILPNRQRLQNPHVLREIAALVAASQPADAREG